MKSLTMRLLAVLLLCVALATVAATPARAHDEGVHIRVAHLLGGEGAPAVDVYVATTDDSPAHMFANVQYHDVTQYVPIEGTSFVLTVATAGAQMPVGDAVVYQAEQTFSVGSTAYYTAVLVSGPEGTLDLVMLDDGAEYAPAMLGEGASGAGEVTIAGAWVRATAGETGAMHREMTGGMGGMDQAPGSGPVSAAYMTITNTLNRPVRLVSATAHIARLTELHETIVENDVARMQHMPEGMEIPAEGVVNLQPGGLHVMLIDLLRDLMPGDTVRLVLRFDDPTLNMQLDLPVVAP